MMRYRTYVEFDIPSLKEQIKGREISSTEFHSPDTLILILSDGEELTLKGVPHTEEANSP